MLRHPAIGLAATVALLAAGLATPARAQDDAAVSAAPAHIAVIDGVAVLERDGRADPATVNVPLVAGDRLRTERGRLEVLFSDGSTLDLDEYSSVDIESDTLLRLLAGRLRLTLEGPESDGALSLRVDTPGGSADIRAGGEYRLALTGDGGPQQLELKVVRGVASLLTDHGAVDLGAGQRAVASAGAPPSYPYSFNAAAWDAFDSWSDAQRNARLGVASSTYLPQDLQAYGGTFDRYGQWRDDSSYGHVWYPSVGSGWRPYYNGQWSYVAPYGWTWIGYDAWSWPTHHYGRWGYASGAWFWIPGRRWGPAWVSWLWAPDYIAWCPLGVGGGPLFSVNLFYRAGHAYDPHYGPRYGPYDGWTVLSRRYFGHRGRSVSVYAVSHRALDRTVRARFAARVAPPSPAGASTRRAAPIRQAGGRRPAAVARGNAGVALSRLSRPAPPSRAFAPRETRSREPVAMNGLAAAAARARAVPRTSARTIRIIGRPRPVAPRPPAAGATVRSPARTTAPGERVALSNRPFDRRAPSASGSGAAGAPGARTPIAGPRGFVPSAPPGRDTGMTRERRPYAPSGASPYGRLGARQAPQYTPPSGRAPSRAAPYTPAPRGTRSAPRARTAPRSGASAPRAAAPGNVRAPRAVPGRPNGGAAPRARTPSGGAARGGTPRGGSAPRGGSTRPAPRGGAVHRTPRGGNR